MLEMNGLSWEKMVRITMDRAPAMVERKAGLATLDFQRVAQSAGQGDSSTLSRLLSTSPGPAQSSVGYPSVAAERKRNKKNLCFLLL
ncbi:hypothetical protein XENOCAPTIV_001110 [Xenoophorus captivus]|uniref:Uncharacterized protein n=1 Tax=Xenoophorus captivus TaxID=1517983 RepID=A0ABV0RPW0_9TELE